MTAPKWRICPPGNVVGLERTPVVMMSCIEYWDGVAGGTGLASDGRQVRFFAPDVTMRTRVYLVWDISDDDEGQDWQWRDREPVGYFTRPRVPIHRRARSHRYWSRQWEQWADAPWTWLNWPGRPATVLRGDLH